MALWQFVFDLKFSSAAVIEGVAAARMSRDQLDAIGLDLPSSIADLLIERVGRLLPETVSWHSDLRIWGDEKTDDVQIGFRGKAVDNVQFRLNVADLQMPLVRGVCELARDIDCVFATRSGAIIRPDSEALVRAITQSNATRYVRNPENFLRKALPRGID